MKESGLTNVKGLMRIIIEKPFGDDLKSAKKLNNQESEPCEKNKNQIEKPFLDVECYLFKYIHLSIITKN